MAGLERYEERTFTHDGVTHRTFARGAGRGLVIVHELPGLTAETVDLADGFVDHGFHVVLPLLFGRPGQSARTGLLQTPMLCVKREFNCFRRGVSSPITDYLRALCRDVHARCGGPGVGAIGMCFTGGFVIPMMVDAAVMAPVSAQPSLPFFGGDAIDVDDGELARAAERANDAPLLALRFADDARCPASRLDRLERVFGERAAAGRTTFRRITVPGAGHSTLTFDYPRAIARGVDTRAQVLAFLRERLG